MVLGPAGLLIPDTVAEAAGMGCPLCDDHEMVPLAPGWEITPIIAKFREKHRGHGDLEAIERRGGVTFITQKIPGLK